MKDELATKERKNTQTKPPTRQLKDVAIILDSQESKRQKEAIEYRSSGGSKRHLGGDKTPLNLDKYTFFLQHVKRAIDANPEYPISKAVRKFGVSSYTIVAMQKIGIIESDTDTRAYFWDLKGDITEETASQLISAVVEEQRDYAQRRRDQKARQKEKESAPDVQGADDKAIMKVGDSNVEIPKVIDEYRKEWEEKRERELTEIITKRVEKEITKKVEKRMRKKYEKKILKALAKSILK